jgi:acyl dehydratase
MEVVFDPIAVRATPSEVAEFRLALREDPPSPADPQAVPFTFPVRWLAVAAVRSHLAAASEGRGVWLMRQEFDYRERLRAGRDYVLEIRLSGPADAQPTIELAGGIRDEQDRPVATVRSTLRIVDPSRQPAQPRSRPRPPEQGGFAAIAAGPIDRPWIAQYAAASLDDNPLHLDRQLARAHGLPDTVVHGTLLTGLLARALGRWCPEFVPMRLSAMFLLPVFAGQSVRMSGRMLQHNPAGTPSDRLVRLVMQREDGAMAAMGEAHVRAADAASAGRNVR